MTTTETGTAAAEDAPDLREPLARAQSWIASLLEGVTPEQRSKPTPCTEFDVTELVEHLYGVAARSEAMGHGHPATSAPSRLEGLPDDLAGSYRERAARGQAAWADDASLTRTVVAPFGSMPGAMVLGIYLAEHLAHGWDLAVATGQPAEADADLAELAHRSISAILPPEPRGGPIPFGPVVEPPVGVGPTERLACYLGRSRASVS